MSYGARKIIIPIDGDYGDDFTDEEPEDWDEDGAVVVQYWVAESEEDDTIGIENGDDQLPIDVAGKVSGAIAELLKWSQSKKGKAEIVRLRAKHEEWLQERLARRAARRQSEGEEGSNGQ